MYLGQRPEPGAPASVHHRAGIQGRYGPIWREYPDVVIGCAGGGSNLGGLIAPYMRDKLTGKAHPRIVAVEPASCPVLSPAENTPMIFVIPERLLPWRKCIPWDAGFIPSANHAGGLRYHGMSPILIQAVSRRLYGGGIRGANQGVRGGRLFCQTRNHPARARKLRMPFVRPWIEAIRVQGNRGGENHPLRT